MLIVVVINICIVFVLCVTVVDSGGFVGKMQNLVVNGNQVFEMLRSGDFKGRSQLRGGGTATLIGPSRLAPPSPLTFRSQEAYLVVSMKIHSTFSIYIQVCICLELEIRRPRSV